MSSLRVESLAGVRVHAVRQSDVIDYIISAVKDGRGGHVVTPNLSILRQAARSAPVRKILNQSDISIADGAPLLLLAKIEGFDLPERVSGSDLIWELSRAAIEDGLTVYLIGGENEGVCSTAVARLRANGNGSAILGMSPWVDESEMSETAAQIAANVSSVGASIVFVGMGFPKQELLISALRPLLPGAWLVGCGAAINFAAGYRLRAPIWMQRSGLEWLHRLLMEPRRMSTRYALDAAFLIRYLIRRIILVQIRSLGKPFARHHSQ